MLIRFSRKCPFVNERPYSNSNKLPNNPSFALSFQCSTSCRAGVKTRTASCQRLKENGVFESVPEVMCDAAITPPLQEVCNDDVPCPGTVI